MDPEKQHKCAVYCRKSVEEGLEQEFNSLDAQREAGEYFIKSQAAKGWICLKKRYEDGGYSGGNTNRPALKELMSDCEAGLVDTIVVYKIDRLSRSICDFAELSKKFDEWGVSFVSVTQDINTSSSSGRMMLNILMTFAQFEREVIAERVRDKMAATRKKGKWVGGTVPYGYRVADKKLEVNEAEAIAVKNVFQRYIEIQSARQIAFELNFDGVATRKGKAWTPNHIYRMLKNHHYIGEVEYKGEVCAGEHVGIIDRAVWDRVHEILDSNTPERRKKGERVASVTMLKGILKCGHCGGAMTPTYGRHNGKTYPYYICSKDFKRAVSSCPVKRISAGDIEKLVSDQLAKFLRTPDFARRIADTAELDVKEVMDMLGDIGTVWNEMYPEEKNRLVQLLIKQAVVTETGLDLEIRTDGVKTLREEMAANAQN